ncbi:hypothetical protein [Lactiplantibacillus plantarum]|uniref:hypothetical protein n=1 Tax=Lactiplantibacillus plantarum TaxID=1590 RepID=UPI001BAB3702|nr:hypothetical protein [Lactiplantibacillus plantarum]MBS0937032.1 hypothetical protein [Lactiplantibacillus plantarum]MBS0944636.1 hypothetical protein [Lactiplantibacillus plantarum]
MDKLVYLVPGFVSYIILRPFGLFNFYSETDRQLTLIFLSLINSAFSSMATKYWLLPYFKWNNNLGTLLLVSVLVTAIYFVIFLCYNKFAPKIADKLNMNLYDNQGTMEHVLSQEPDGKKEQFLIIFDFNDNYISSGYVRNVDDQGNQQVELYGEDEQTFSIGDARIMYEEDDKNSIIVDYKNRLKSYVILQ